MGECIQSRKYLLIVLKHGPGCKSLHLFDFLQKNTSSCGSPLYFSQVYNHYTEEKTVMQSLRLYQNAIGVFIFGL